MMANMGEMAAAQARSYKRFFAHPKGLSTIFFTGQCDFSGSSTPGRSPSMDPGAPRPIRVLSEQGQRSAPDPQTPGIAFLSGLSSSVSTTAIASAMAARMMKNDDCFQMDQ